MRVSACLCERSELDILAEPMHRVRGTIAQVYMLQDIGSGVQIHVNSLIFLPRIFTCVQKPHSADAIKRRHIQADTHSNAIPRLLLRQDDAAGVTAPSFHPFHPFHVALRGHFLRLVPEEAAGPPRASPCSSLYLGSITLPNGTHFGPLSGCVLLFSQLESHRGSGVVSLDTHLEAVHPTLGP